MNKVSDEPLMAEARKAERLSEQADDTFGAQRGLSSRSDLKKTNFKADEIRMKGVGLGGSSLFPTRNHQHQRMDTVVSVVWVISVRRPGKVLAGKLAASVSYGIDDKTKPSMAAVHQD